MNLVIYGINTGIERTGVAIVTVTNAPGSLVTYQGNPVTLEMLYTQGPILIDFPTSGVWDPENEMIPGWDYATEAEVLAYIDGQIPPDPVPGPPVWPYNVSGVGTGAGTVASGDDPRFAAAAPATRTITAGTGLTGGGNLTADRTISLDLPYSDGRYQILSQKAQANGYASLDASGKIPSLQLPDSILGALQFQSTWNAATNTPAIPVAAAGNKGWFYIVTTAGSTNIGGITSWAVGDWVLSDGAAWSKVLNSDAVVSVAGKTGAVTIQAADITDGTAAGRAVFTAANATAQRTALGLGDSATRNVGTTAGTVAAGDDSRVTGAAQKSANLSDLASAPTARTNLGLGGAATLNVGTAASTVAAGNDARFSTVPNGYITDIKVASGAAIALSKIATSGAATWTGKQTWTAAGIEFNGAPGVDVPIATNPWFIGDSKTWQIVRVAAGSATLPETGIQAILTSNVGGANPSTAFKVAVFGAARGNTGTADVYGGNFVAELTAGVSSARTCIALEADVNSHNADYGNTFGPITDPYLCALYLATGGTMKATAAQLVNCMGSNKFNRGLGFFNGTFNFNTIEDWTTSGASLYIGGTKTYGVDTAGCTIGGSGSALRLGNSQYISWRNAANNTDRRVIVLGADDNLYFQDIASGIIVVDAGIIPATNNTRNLGAPGSLWGTIYAQTGSISQSDPALKTDKQPLPDGMLEIVASLDPKTFRWISGGVEYEEVEEERLVQDEVVEQVEVDAIEERDSKFYTVKRTEERRSPAFDTLPVIDPETGEQAFTEHRTRVRVGKGRKTKTVIQKIPQTHSVPRMVRKLVKVRKPVEREGRRTHWGFMADEVRDAMAKTGRDFGGYVEMEDGTTGLRPDQLIPVLWKAVQELSEKVERLQNRE